MNRLIAAVAALAPVSLALTGCGPNYSPNTYATNAAQQASKVEAGVIVGVRKVQISSSGAVGGVAGAAAGGVAGAQVGTGATSTFAAIGGSVLGGLAGVATEHIVGDTNGYEYIVRKANGDMISVAQTDKKPLWVGEKVLVIAGPQARIVADYTVPFEPPPKPPAAAPAAATAAAQGASAAAGGSAPHPATASTPVTVPPAQADTAVPPQLPQAFGSPAAAPPPIITPPAVTPSAPVAPNAY